MIDNRDPLAANPSGIAPSDDGQKPRVLYLADLRFRLFETESANVHIRGITHALRERVELLEPPCTVGLVILRAISTRGRPRGAARLVEALGLSIATLESSLFALTHRVDFAYARHAIWLGPALAVLRLARVPIILEVNGLVVTERRQAGNTSRALDLMSALELRIVGLAHRVRCVSARLSRELAAAGVPAEKLFVAHNGVDERVFYTCPQRRADAHLVGFIGSGQAWHQLPVLVEAFERVVREVPSARLVLVGPDAPALAEKVGAFSLGELIEMRGAVSHTEAIAAYHEIDVAVNPGSAPHHSPLKLFEAMALGKPIVAARAEGICEVLENERNALLVEPGDPAALAHAIVRLLTDRTLRERIGDAARQDAMEAHTWQRVAAAILAAAGISPRP